MPYCCDSVVRYCRPSATNGSKDLPVNHRSITTVFDDLPMLPFERFTLSLRGGDHAVLVNPATCGTHTLASRLAKNCGR